MVLDLVTPFCFWEFAMLETPMRRFRRPAKSNHSGASPQGRCNGDGTLIHKSNSETGRLPTCGAFIGAGPRGISGTPSLWMPLHEVRLAGASGKLRAGTIAVEAEVGNHQAQYLL